MSPSTPVHPFAGTATATRRLVLLLYALVGPVFLGSLFVLGSPRPDVGPVLAVGGLIAAGAIWTYVRRTPTAYDWIFPVTIAPAVCCGIGFAACGQRGLVYLVVIGAPLAWTAVLFPAPIVLFALGAASAIVFAALSSRLGVRAAAVSTVTLFPVAASVAWVVYATAERLRTALATVSREQAERARAVEALRESEERFRATFETSPDAIHLHRPDGGQFVAINEGFSRMTGWPEAEVKGRSPLDLGLWDDPAEGLRLLAELDRHGHVTNLEVRLRARDGRVVTGLVSARIIALRGERLVLSIVRDVSALKRAEEERERLKSALAQAAKMEAIGVLAGGIAHDFNNVLTVILAGARSLADDAERGAATDVEIVAEIRGAGERARDLVRQLLGFARRQMISPVPLDLNETISGSQQLLQRLLGDHIQFGLKLQPGLWPVRCDPGQVEQVLFNLVVNARDAMPSGGTLSIETANVEVDAQLVALHPWLRPASCARFAVVDSGHGMSEEVKARIFEPFFTTKPVGQGTGLGLAMVYGIVKQNDGFILVESAPGQGARFEVLLPRIPPTPG